MGHFVYRVESRKTIMQSGLDCQGRIIRALLGHRLSFQKNYQKYYTEPLLSSGAQAQADMMDAELPKYSVGAASWQGKEKSYELLLQCASSEKK